MLLQSWLLICCWWSLHFLFRRKPVNPQCLHIHFPQRNGSSNCLLCDLQIPRCNCFFKPPSLMPLLHSGCVQCLFPNVRPFEVPLATLSLVQFFRHLCLTIGPLWSCLICHVAPAWWVICLLAAANFFQDPPLPWVYFLGCRRHPTPRCQSPYCSFSALNSFHCSPFFRDLFMHHYRLYLHWGWLITPRQASITSWQAVVSFRQAFTLAPILSW
jgi:hypothetical protein